MVLMREDDPTLMEARFTIVAAGTMFGRSPGAGPTAVVIGADDLAISRLCGWIGHTAEGTWCVQRRGNSGVLRERAGKQTLLEKGDYRNVRNLDTLILRGRRWYRLLLELPADDALAASTQPATVASDSNALRLDVRQRRVAAALCASLLDSSQPDSTSNARLAELLGGDIDAMDARVSRLRNAVSKQTGTRLRSRPALAELLVASAAVTPADLAELLGTGE